MGTRSVVASDWVGGWSHNSVKMEEGQAGRASRKERGVGCDEAAGRLLSCFRAGHEAGPGLRESAREAGPYYSQYRRQGGQDLREIGRRCLTTDLDRIGEC